MVFYDTGGGDIYAGATKEDCIKAMLADNPDTDLKDIREVSGDTPMRLEPPDEAELMSTLAEEYTDLGYGYCIASDNC